jgi:hypothetical protein
VKTWCLKLLILLLLGGLGIDQVCAQVHPSDPDCPNAFRDLFATLKSHLGDAVTDKRFPDAEVSFLGQGHGGGNVYHVKPKDGSSPFVVKDYVLGGDDSAINDALGLQILDHITSGRATPKAMRPVKLLERLDIETLKLEYVSGRDVQKIAAETVDAEARTKLARLFMRQLETLKNDLPHGKELTVGKYSYKVLDSTYYPSKVSGFQDLVVVLRRKEYPKDLVQLWIKPDNVVITPDGDFVIIDPR